MKKIFKYISIVAAAALVPAVAGAQTKGEPGYAPDGVVINKTVTEVSGVVGQYNVTLESYTTGQTTTTVTEVNVPMDIVLLLDVSGSMNNEVSVSKDDPVGSSTQIANNGTESYYFELNGSKYYFWRASGGSSNNRTWYYGPNYNNSTGRKVLNGVKSNSITPQQISTALGQNVTVYHTTSSNVSKMSLLQTGVSDFINVVKNNATADGKTVDHKISIVKFAMDKYLNNDGNSIAPGDDSYRYSSTLTDANYTQVVKFNEPVSSESTSLTNAVNSLHAGGATAADYGFNLAEKVFAQMRADNGQYVMNGNEYVTDESGNRVERPRILVFFTDGAPTHGSSFSADVAKDVVNKSKELKTSGITIFSVGALTNPGENVIQFLDYTSSNYRNASATITTTNWETTINYSNVSSSDKTGDNYYQLTDGADLSSIFRAIAEQSTSGGATYKLEASTTTVVDVVSQYFEIPEGTKASDIKIYTAAASGKDASGAYTFDPKQAATGMSPVIDGTQVSVSGFDFSENYVSYDETKKVYTGKKLIIEFPVVMKSDNPGGTAQFTNDLESGIFVKKDDGSLDQIAWFQRPTVDLPNILIRKDGLMKGESAIFTISGRSADGRELNVQAIATCYKDGDPAYARVVLQKNGTYTVTEMTAWTWSRDVELVGTYAKGTATVNENNASITRALGADTEQEDGKYKGTLFLFKNPAKSGQPAHAEAVVTNTFGQNGATASAVTTNND